MDVFFQNAFFQFVIQYWHMWLLLVIVLVLLLYEEVKTKRYGVPMVSPQEVITLMNRDSAVVIDIRDTEAFTQGHIIGSLNLPTTTIATIIDKLTAIKVHRDKPIVIVCARGQRCLAVANSLRKENFSQVYGLAGGITAWKNTEIPLIK